jgi:hypothetical protein
MGIVTLYTLKEAEYFILLIVIKYGIIPKNNFNVMETYDFYRI